MTRLKCRQWAGKSDRQGAKGQTPSTDSEGTRIHPPPLETSRRGPQGPYEPSEGEGQGLGPLLPEDPRKDAKGLYARRDADPLPVLLAIVAETRNVVLEQPRPHGGP